MHRAIAPGISKKTLNRYVEVFIKKETSMAPLFGGKDDETKKLGEQMQNLSEQIGKLQQELAAKTAEADRLRTQAAQNVGSQAAYEEAQAQLDVLRKQVAELQNAQQTAGTSSGAGAKVSSANEAPTSTGNLAVSATAYVTRAGGLPLRMRAGPSLNESILDRLQPGTQMSLLEGPRQADGHGWWHIRTVDGREGWVAGEELRTQPD
jgi:hypothetical protein